MTKYVLAPDSFKESMTAKEVCEAMEKGILKANPTAEIVKVPMADGGEGTVDSLVDATHGKRIYLNVKGPLNQDVQAYYGILGDKKTAIIEMAKASGLELLTPNLRNPAKATTYGTGQLIKDALDQGMKRIIIGLGGSSTNDGGAGMSQALGAYLLDEKGNELTPGGGQLNKLAKIDISELDPRLQSTQIILASDVTNPLTGKNGASYVFGKQKGANASLIEQLDQNLSHYAHIIKRDLGKDIENLPGAGLMAFTNAQMEKGIDLVIKLTHLEEKIRQADYVFTGEGGTDFQTKFGKAPYGVAQLAQRYQKPVFSLAGYLGDGIEDLYQYGFTAFFGILAQASSLEEALKNGPQNVERTTENIVRTLMC